VKTTCRSDGGASRDTLGHLGTSGCAPIGFSGLTRSPDRSSYIPDERGVEHACSGCGGGMGAREELCGSCPYVRDERLGRAAS
jgi:hypothetical protein